jgi:hypothetical protein
LVHTVLLDTSINPKVATTLNRNAICLMNFRRKLWRRFLKCYERRIFVSHHGKSEIKSCKFAGTMHCTCSDLH